MTLRDIPWFSDSLDPRQSLMCRLTDEILKSTTEAVRFEFVPYKRMLLALDKGTIQVGPAASFRAKRTFYRRFSTGIGRIKGNRILARLLSEYWGSPVPGWVVDN